MQTIKECSVAKRAIERSVSHNEIVTIDADDYSAELVEYLESESDGSADTTYERGDLLEFWGTDAGGDEWRVHVRHEVEP